MDSAKNGILAQEMNHIFAKKRGRGGFMGLELNMQKSYDKIEWSIVLAILKQFRFSEIFTKWIEQCSSTMSYSILLNVSPKARLYPSRGLLQGNL